MPIRPAWTCGDCLSTATAAATPASPSRSTSSSSMIAPGSWSTRLRSRRSSTTRPTGMRSGARPPTTARSSSRSTGPRLRRQAEAPARAQRTAWRRARSRRLRPYGKLDPEPGHRLRHLIRRLLRPPVPRRLFGPGAVVRPCWQVDPTPAPSRSRRTLTVNPFASVIVALGVCSHGARATFDPWNLWLPASPSAEQSVAATRAEHATGRIDDPRTSPTTGCGCSPAAGMTWYRCPNVQTLEAYYGAWASRRRSSISSTTPTPITVSRSKSSPAPALIPTGRATSTVCRS